jgi:deaminated glutathione amidase
VRAAAIQLNSTDDFARNLEAADRHVRAAADGATLVVLPEKWPALGAGRVAVDGAQDLDGPAVGWARATARELGLDLVAGSISERSGEGRARNTCVHVGPDGEVRAIYRKLHLFDVEIEGTAYRESEHEDAGDEVVVSRTAGGTGLGLAICYDLRFPELFRALGDRGAEIVALPSAFTLATTREHWEPLLRARAIENQTYVVAANQVGEHPGGIRSGGRSTIVDPWGVVLAQAPDAEGHVVADLDPRRQADVRRRLPALTHRRREVLP